MRFGARLGEVDFAELARSIQRYLDTHCGPHRFRVVSLVHYGSRARDEGGVFSDVDLAVMVISSDALCGNLMGPEDLALVRDIWGAIPIVEDDYWKDIIVDVIQTNRDWSIVCPTSEIYDARVIALCLAKGKRPQALTIASGLSYLDPEGIHSHLKHCVRHGGLRPVLNSHLVEELVLRSEGGRKQMHDDLDELKSGRVEWPDEPPVARIVYGVHLWVKPAVQCIREAVGAWTLVEKGWPEWRRKHVLRFIRSHYPDVFTGAREVYSYKSTLRGRVRFRRLLKEHPAQILERIETITDEIDSFWQRIVSRIREKEEGLQETPSGISRQFLKHPLLQPGT